MPWMMKQGDTHAVKATICDILRKLDRNKKPYLDVKECLDCLAPLPSVVLDASHVPLHSINGVRSVSVVEEPRA
jgi:hypothetical protein